MRKMPNALLYQRVLYLVISFKMMQCVIQATRLYNDLNGVLSKFVFIFNPIQSTLFADVEMLYRLFFL